MGVAERKESGLPEHCPRCGASTAGGYAPGVGENDDGSMYVYCHCGFVLSGEEKDRAEQADADRP